MSVCRQCPKCRGWGKLRSRTGVIIDCGSCLGSGCAKHKATPGLPVGANCMKLRAAVRPKDAARTYSRWKRDA